LDSDEAERRFDALCLHHFGRHLHQHTAVRRRTLGVLLDPACTAWPWSTVQQYCGLSEPFLCLLYEGLRDGVEAAIQHAEQIAAGDWTLAAIQAGDPRRKAETATS
jgi:hypothetical protein